MEILSFTHGERSLFFLMLSTYFASVHGNGDQIQQCFLNCKNPTKNQAYVYIHLTLEIKHT